MGRRVKRSATAIAPNASPAKEFRNPLGEITARQRLTLAALISLVTIAALYALTIYIDEHTSACLQAVAGGFENIVCYQFSFYPGVSGLAVAEFNFESRVVLAPIGFFAAALLVYPLVPAWIALARARWRTFYTPLAIGTTCCALAAFIVHYGNRHFGGFDFSILVEHGWRLAQGQIPYRDFVCTLPPGFFLGVKWAFLVFGIRWNAILWATALFSCATFLWMFFLLRRITDKPLAAYLTSLSVTVAANLVLCFWWYNNVTNITVTLFFLSCILLLKDQESVWPQISYAVSLAMLGMMKPNVAGLSGIIGVGILIAFSAKRQRIALLTVAAVAANVLFLTANHVSIPGMLDSYRELARGRKGALLIGLLGLPAEQLHAYLFLPLLLMPYWIWPSRLRAARREQNRTNIGICFLLLAAPLISMTGILTNGEFKDVEWPILICGSVILLCANLSDPPPSANRLWSVRVLVCCLCALFVSDIYMGVERFRVRGIGEHAFFEWNELVHEEGHPFFADLWASERFWRVLNQVESVRKLYPGGTFFGPRIEFAYGVFRVPSPLHISAWWDPTTSFAEDRTPEMEAAWKADKFQTLIFMKLDAIHFREEFLQEMLARYEHDRRWRDVTVLHSNTPGGAARDK